MDLTEELSFFEGALRALPVEMADLMWDLVVEQMKWDALLNRSIPFPTPRCTGCGKRRFILLEKIYEQHDTGCGLLLCWGDCDV